MRELAKHVDVVLVIGAHNSSNSNRLQECAEEVGVPAYLIEDASHLQVEWLSGQENASASRRAHRRPKIWCRN